LIRGTPGNEHFSISLRRRWKLFVSDTSSASSVSDFPCLLRRKHRVRKYKYNQPRSVREEEPGKRLEKLRDASDVGRVDGRNQGIQSVIVVQLRQVLQRTTFNIMAYNTLVKIDKR